MQEIAPGVFVENCYPPYNLGLITIADGGLVVDVPPRPTHARQWLREVQEVTGPIRYVVLTDAQPDRLIGAALWNVPIIASETTARYIAALDEKAWLELLNNAQERFSAENLSPESLPPRRVTLACNRELRLHYRAPALEIEAIAGAALGSLWLTVPDQQVLFAGDSVVFREPPLLDRTPDRQAWLGSLAALEKRTAIRWIVPVRGHINARRGDLEAQREFMRVAWHTAQTLAQETVAGTGLAQATRELREAFFPTASKHSEIQLRIRHGLEQLGAEIRAAQELEPVIGDQDSSTAKI